MLNALAHADRRRTQQGERSNRLIIVAWLLSTPVTFGGGVALHMGGKVISGLGVGRAQTRRAQITPLRFGCVGSWVPSIS
jgi:uncharacterized protein GlcG (DUF336 family)